MIRLKCFHDRVRLFAAPGAGIHKAIEEAIVFAMQEGVNVDFTFNGEVVHVCRSSIVDKVYLEYLELSGCNKKISTTQMG